MVFITLTLSLLQYPHHTTARVIWHYADSMSVLNNLRRRCIFNLLALLTV